MRPQGLFQFPLFKYPTIAVLFLLFSCTGGTQETSNSEPDNVLEGMKLKTLDGGEIDLTTYKGKTLFINFWATWCKPCIEEMPAIARARKLLADDEVKFLLISNEPRAQIQKFIAQHDFNLPFGQLNMPLEQLNIQGLPTTFIISPNGKLTFSEPGAREWDLEENLNMIRQAKDVHPFPL